jgi:hypothetical protein
VFENLCGRALALIEAGVSKADDFPEIVESASNSSSRMAAALVRLRKAAK